MADNLTRELAALRHGDHLCLPYDCDDERDEVIAPFIAEGLARGERCVYLIAQDQHEPLMKMLAAAGVNAGRARDRGALWLRTPEETYFRSGTFDADDTLAYAEELVAGALSDGFTGVRATGDIGDPTSHDVPWQTIYSYEARFNERFARRPVVALCRYHRPATSAAMVADALRTHPTAVVGGRVCRNPYYENPDIALCTTGSDVARVEWMLCQLRRGSASDLRAREMTRSLAGETARLSAQNQSRAHVEEGLERAVHVRDRFLDVLTEELSGPVAGLAVEIQSLVRASGGGQGAETSKQRSDLLAAMGQHLDRLGKVVDELKEVSRLTNRAAAVWDDVDLADVARQVTLRNRERMAADGSTVSFRSETRIQGRWDRRRVEQLLANLLLNVSKRGAHHPIELELATDGGRAIISVRYRGAPQPEDRDETPRTGSGTGDGGLWISREIASSFGGLMTIRHVDANGEGIDIGQAADAHATAHATPDDQITTVITVDLPRGGPRPRAAAY